VYNGIIEFDIVVCHIRNIPTFEKWAMQNLSAQPASLRVLGTSGVQDLQNGLLQWRLWWHLGWLEIRRRYSRTVIGPFWSAISLGMFVIALGSVGTGLWNRSAADYLPFLAAGMVVWVMLASIVNESCLLFVSSSNLFRQMNLNYSVLAFALVWRNIIVFAHNFLVFLLMFVLLAPQMLSPVMLLAVPGFALVVTNCVWVSILLGMFCLRFRDVQQLVGSLVQIAMFITPIFWPPESLSGPGRIVFVDMNPLYHILDIVRSPLLGRVPALESYVYVAAMTVVGWTLTIWLFSYFRKRIAYWS
jgi:ABC-type polysaccharide/polyol phosphate export permease